MSHEAFDVIYDNKLFTLILTCDNKKPITKENLNLGNYYIEAYRNSKEKIDLNYEKFNTTLTEILSGEDDLLKIRAILLMFMMKNCIDATTIFEILLTEDIINTNAETEEETEEEESLFNSDSRYFNNIF